MKTRLFTIACLLAMLGRFAAAATPTNLQPNPHHLNPPPGVVVPPEVKAELTAGAAALGREIESLRATLKSKPELLGFLSDVQIYHNAVRSALEDDIFTGTNQFNSARGLLQQGAARARLLARDRKSTRLNSSHGGISRMPASA